MQGLTHQAATIDGQAVLGAQRQPGVLEVQQLLGGDVDRHLLVVLDPATGLARCLGLRLVGYGVDRGRLVREAVALVLADLEQNGDDSVLVQRLTQA